MVSEESGDHDHLEDIYHPTASGYYFMPSSTAPSGGIL